MKWFWSIALLTVASVVIATLLGFFSTFEPRDWTTFIPSAAAFLISVYALSRGRVPQPHWRINEVYLYNERDLYCKVKQLGPGVAENVQLEVQAPGQEWVKVRQPSILRKNGGVLPRNGAIAVRLWSGLDDVQTPLGKYRVRVTWTSLPNTTRERSRTLVHNHDGKTGPRPRRPLFVSS